ncbi:hypothetical protein O1M63_01725 [Streptomyces mirabilis]|nr:hypothetical protein [Streptomyces mirabilis]
MRDMFRTFAARFRIGSADEVKPTARTAAQEALGELGLAELRRPHPWPPPSRSAPCSPRNTAGSP